MRSLRILLAALTVTLGIGVLLLGFIARLNLVDVAPIAACGTMFGATLAALLFTFAYNISPSAERTNP